MLKNAMKSEVLMGLKHLVELGFDVEFLEVILFQSVLLVTVVGLLARLLSD